MAHDVFLSHSSKDKTIADATCATLEAKGIRCWIAPRDIRPGADWGEAIVDAINEARVFVLVFSSNANTSPQIKREVERTINRGVPIIPFRIENVMPGKSLEYFLSTPHWLDAFSPPLEQHLDYLASVVRSILDGQAAPEPPHPVPIPRRLDRRLLIGGGAGVVTVAAAAGYFLLGRQPPSFVGKWKAEHIEMGADTPSPFAPFSINAFFKAAVASGKLSGTLEVDEVGSYKSTFGGDDAGTIAPDDRGGLRFSSEFAHTAWPFTTRLLNTPPAAMVTALGGQGGDAAITLSAAGIGDSMLVGTSRGAGIVGHWYTDTPAVGLFDATKTSLDVTLDGRYRYHFAFTESGTFQAADSKWTRLRQGAPPVSGTYKFDGGDRVTTAGGGGVTIWARAE